MDMLPPLLPDKLPSERVAVYLQLATAIGTEFIVGVPLFASDPIGLVFSDETTLDGFRTAAALVSGGVEGTEYVVSAVCELDSGQIVQPVVTLPVVTPSFETLRRRPIVL